MSGVLSSKQNVSNSSLFVFTFVLMLNVTSSKVCLLSVIVFTFVPILYMSSKGCLLSMYLFLFLSPFYTCQARAVYSLCICFYFCPHFIHVMLSKGCLLYICFSFCPHFIHVKQGLFILHVFIFVPILYMWWAVYSLCFHFCPHVTHVMSSKDSLLCFCFCPHVIGLHVAPSNVYSMLIFK